MAAPVYTHRLYGGIVTATRDLQLVEVPPGEAWIVRDLVVANLGSNEVSIAIYFQLPGPDYPRLLVGRVQAQETIHLETRQRLYVGERMYLAASSSGTFSVSLLITGYIFATSP